MRRAFDLGPVLHVAGGVFFFAAFVLFAGEGQRSRRSFHGSAEVRGGRRGIMVDLAQDGINRLAHAFGDRAHGVAHVLHELLVPVVPASYAVDHVLRADDTQLHQVVGIDGRLDGFEIRRDVTLNVGALGVLVAERLARGVGRGLERVCRRLRRYGSS